ncbi:hypothetical protein D9M68_1000450 [compost metagenome]
MKCDAEGFAEYYRQRSMRLASLSGGYVRFHLQLLPEANGGRLIVRVEDSGPGFDGQAILERQLQLDSLCGRGLALVRQLSERCTWPADGQGVSVEFSWSTEA